LWGVSRDIHGSAQENRVELKSPEMEQDVVFECLVTAVSSGLYSYRLDSSVETFRIGVGLLEPEDVRTLVKGL
jgi:hypothetical protein